MARNSIFAALVAVVAANENIAGLQTRPAVLAFNAGGCGAPLSDGGPITIAAARSGACLPISFSAGFVPPESHSTYRLQCGLVYTRGTDTAVAGTGVIQVCNAGCSQCSTEAVTSGQCLSLTSPGFDHGPGMTVTCLADSVTPALNSKFAGSVPPGMVVTSWYPGTQCTNATAVVSRKADGSCVRAPVNSAAPMWYAVDCSGPGGSFKLCDDDQCSRCGDAMLASGPGACITRPEGLGDGFASVSMQCSGDGGAAGVQGATGPNDGTAGLVMGPRGPLADASQAKGGVTAMPGRTANKRDVQASGAGQTTLALGSVGTAVLVLVASSMAMRLGC